MTVSSVLTVYFGDHCPLFISVIVMNVCRAEVVSSVLVHPREYGVYNLYLVKLFQPQLLSPVLATRLRKPKTISRHQNYGLRFNKSTFAFSFVHLNILRN